MINAGDRFAATIARKQAHGKPENLGGLLSSQSVRKFNFEEGGRKGIEYPTLKVNTLLARASGLSRMGANTGLPVPPNTNTPLNGTANTQQGGVLTGTVLDSLSLMGDNLNG